MKNQCKKKIFKKYFSTKTVQNLKTSYKISTQTETVSVVAVKTYHLKHSFGKQLENVK